MRFASLVIFAIAVLPALAGCGRDAAAEAPVSVKPGLYEATLHGRAFTPFYADAPEDLSKRSCVTAERAEHFPQVFARKYFEMEGACSGPLAERVGNRVTGKVSCPISQSGIVGELNTEFEGDVSEETVQVRAVSRLVISEGDPEKRAKLESTPLGKEGVDLRLDIRRIGDCAA